MKAISSLFAAVLLTTVPSGASIVWVGGSSTDFWDDANWDFSGSTYTGSTFNPLTPIADNIVVTNATGLTVATDQGIRIDNGFSLALSATDLFVNGTSANSGINGVDDVPATNPSNGVASTIVLTNGSLINTQFTALGITVNIDATSQMQYRGSGDPINGQSETTLINMVPGARLTLPTQAEFTEQATTQNSFIFVDGVSLASDPSLLSYSGAGPVTGTAIPEPSAALIAALVGFSAILRRRK